MRGPEGFMKALVTLALCLAISVALDAVEEPRVQDLGLVEDLIELGEQPAADAALALKTELKMLGKLTAQAKKTMDETEGMSKELTRSVEKKQLDSEISIVNEAEEASVEEVGKAMDMKVQPCDDFFSYVCGRWVNQTEIPADKPSWGRTFPAMSKRHVKTLESIMDGNKTTRVDNVQMAKVHRYYKSCMSPPANSTNSKFLSMTKQVLGVKDVRELITVWGQMDIRGFGLTPYSFGPGGDDKEPDKMVGYLGQGGLGLPDRDYYIKSDDRFKKLREGYTQLMNELFQAVHVPDFSPTAETAAQILGFETKLAKASWTKVELRDPVATYNPTTVEQFQSGHLSFENYFKQIYSITPNFAKTSKLVISTPSFFEQLEVLLAKEPLDNLKAYTLWRLMRETVGTLSDEFGALMFKFYGTALNGIQERPPLWKRCVSATTEALWQISDQAFVDEEFPGDSKTKAQEMLDGIKAAFHVRLSNLTWMDQETKQGAYMKVKKLGTKVGYPDKWRSYENVTIGDNHFSNFLEVSRDGAAREFQKLGGFKDKTAWHMHPSMVNAYYSPGSNEMVFPAGILQPPFFSKDFPMVINYGSIGSVMGHELSHAFDDQGSQFDSSGKMTNWFTNSSKEAFDNKTQCYVNQYSGFKAEEVNLNVNGELTLGENIADNAGAQVALDAYRTWAEANNAPRLFSLNGKQVSDIQLFWIAYGQVWCSKQRPEALMMQMRNDPHSPGRFRSVGPGQNSPDFSEAFQCAADSAMVPRHRCALW
jgi:endothelin-converting enzyme/putative endopeptidase